MIPFRDDAWTLYAPAFVRKMLVSAATPLDAPITKCSVLPPPVTVNVTLALLEVTTFPY